MYIDLLMVCLVSWGKFDALSALFISSTPRRRHLASIHTLLLVVASLLLEPLLLLPCRRWAME